MMEPPQFDVNTPISPIQVLPELVEVPSRAVIAKVRWKMASKKSKIVLSQRDFATLFSHISHMKVVLQRISEYSLVF